MSHAEKMSCLWMGVLVLSSLYIVCSWVAAGNTHVSCSSESEVKTPTIDHNLAFVLVWHSLLVAAFGVGSTYVMKKKRSSFGVGLVIGATAVISSFTFCVSVMEGSEIRQKKKLTELCNLEEDLSLSSDTAVVVLGIFLAILYVGFGIMLYQSKENLFEHEALIDNENESGYPSQSFQESTNPYQNAPTVI